MNTPTRPPRVAVVGAGIAGLACAGHLLRLGAAVTVYEKSRGLGGRAAVKRLDEGSAVDLGAQFMTASDPDFAALVEEARLDRRAAVWEARFAHVDARAGAVEAAHARPRWVGTPGMNDWTPLLLAREHVRFQRRVEVTLRGADGQWRVGAGDDGSGGGFDALVLAVPAPQAVALAPEGEVRDRLATVTMTPCWAVALAVGSPLDPGYDAAFVRGSPLSWVARHGSRPDRQDQEHVWVLHGSPDWSRDHLESLPEVVTTALGAAFRALPGVGGKVQGLPLVAHRWRYATPAPGPAPGLVWCPATRLAACGDWAVGGRVEGAFVSGRDAARTVARSLGLGG